MVVNLHNHYRGYLAARPGMVSPGFSQAVAGYLTHDANSQHCSVDDAPRLYSADGSIVLAVAGKNKGATPVWEVQPQRKNRLFVQCNSFFFASFLLPDSNMGTECLPLLVINVRPL